MTQPTRRCAKCGAHLAPAQQFCGECGAPAGHTPAPPPLKASPPPATSPVPLPQMGPAGPAPGPPLAPVEASDVEDVSRPWQAAALVWLMGLTTLGLLVTAATLILPRIDYPRWQEEDRVVAGFLCLGYSPFIALLWLGLARRWRRAYIFCYFLAFGLVFLGLTAAKQPESRLAAGLAAPGLLMFILLASKRTREYYDITWGWLWFGHARRDKDERKTRKHAPAKALPVPTAPPPTTPPPSMPTMQPPVVVRPDVCPQCGASVSPDERFCGECGTRIG